MMWATRETVPASITGACVDLLPPVASSPDQVVALLAEFDQIVAQHQVAQAQQLRNRHLTRTGQAGLALTTEFGSEPMAPALLQGLDALLLLSVEWSAPVSQLAGQVQI